MRLFDTHAHLEDEQLQPQLESLLQLAIEAGVIGITSIGTTLESSQRCVALAARFPQVQASVGIHPNHCHEASLADWSDIAQLALDPNVVAIGETGLDRHWDYCPFETQHEWFAKHIELSFETAKPLVIHMRDCETDILDMLRSHRREGKINGIMHSFGGSWETAQQCLDWGMYVSFSGMVTFKNSASLRAIAAKIPSDRILIETDSPYLAPHPHRGQRPNHPALITHTATCLADVRNISPQALAELTTRNARQVFGLPEDPPIEN